MTVGHLSSRQEPITHKAQASPLCRGTTHGTLWALESRLCSTEEASQHDLIKYQERSNFLKVWKLEIVTGARGGTSAGLA